MMKGAVFYSVIIAVIMLISSCGIEPGQTPELTADSKERVIYVNAPTYEVPDMIDKYIELHPDFEFTINKTVIATTDGLYGPALDEGLASGGGFEWDIYCCVGSDFTARYTQGEMSGFAMPYEELGIDVDAEIKKAKIARYIIDLGTRPRDGKVVGLAYQSTAGVFIYRRSIAKDVWGTDDTAVIKTKIGPGWDKFFGAAAELKAGGYCIVSGSGDIWHAVEGSSDTGWLTGGNNYIEPELYIDPKREAFLDYYKELIDKGYSNDTKEWAKEWYNDMTGIGERKVFGFFGSAWMVNQVMAGNCGAIFDEKGKLIKTGGTYGDWAVCEPPAGFFKGGTWVLANRKLSEDPAKKAAVADLIDWITLECGEDSLQSYYAGGVFYKDSYDYLANGSVLSYSGMKDTPASGTVMETSDGTVDFLGGQDMYDVFESAGRMANGRNISLYDGTINAIWLDMSGKYAHGIMTRGEAIAEFKRLVKEYLDIDAL